MLGCTECGGRLRTSRVRQRLEDLPQVIVDGVIIGRCVDCGKTEIGYERMGPLLRTISLALALKETPLVGDEIRFIRGHLGWSGGEFAANMGVTRATVSRWEKDRLKMGASAERLLRLMAVVTDEGEAAPTDVLRLPAREGKGPLRIRVSLRRGVWQAVAA